MAELAMEDPSRQKVIDNEGTPSRELGDTSLHTVGISNLNDAGATSYPKAEIIFQAGNPSTPGTDGIRVAANGDSSPSKNPQAHTFNAKQIKGHKYLAAIPHDKTGTHYTLQDVTAGTPAETFVDNNPTHNNYGPNIIFSHGDELHTADAVNRPGEKRFTFTVNTNTVTTPSGAIDPGGASESSCQSVASCGASP